ncbi:MAG: hypothetical protein B7Y86_10850 [Brevundimonas subvibrioides]|jgi:predicted transcriptional regulator|uniref:Uncharacterized protein n=1 Tax=Brevundimonas subvibrioides TaxID=74313 RepID=A0A258HIQ8_9CAUL|nr:hypothetical protein [Brevundimonas subvibrioides]OYX56203.1 MAG: hypothetical protein B7Y86_10850 [Brevundimonas subvibrioides]
MPEIYIELSDETLERLTAYADALEMTPEAALTQIVRAGLQNDESRPDGATGDEYRAFVQKGIDSADRGDLEDWDVVKARLRVYMDEQPAVAAE